MMLLNVPFAEKDDAKALGAKWNPKIKKWYIPDGIDGAPFARWMEGHSVCPASSPAHPAKLYVDLVPNSAWFSNLRSELTAGEWEQVKKATFKAANNQCEVCGGRGPRHPVECHERWRYDESIGLQTLTGTIALCPACHESTHFGLARVHGRDQEAKRHLMHVNRWDDTTANMHIRNAMDEWKRRSDIKWKLDARWLLTLVPLSQSTQKKILDHAAGLAERTVADWQEDVITAQARACGVGSSPTVDAKR